MHQNEQIEEVNVATVPSTETKTAKPKAKRPKKSPDSDMTQSPEELRRQYIEHLPELGTPQG